MSRDIDDIIPDLISERFSYDPETGCVFHKSTGARADWPHNRGYRCVYVCIGGKRKYPLAHRVAFVIMTGRWPFDEIDHINRVKDDNRWSNLRESTSAENNRNVDLTSLNTSGLRGVSWHKHTKKWRAQINASGRRCHIGYFRTKEDAHEAYKMEAMKLHGEFYSGR